MGNFFSEEIDKSDPRWLLNQDSSKRISQQMAKTIITVHQQYKRELGGDKEKAYCCMLRDFDKLLIETVPTLKGRAHFETRKSMLTRNLPKGDIKDFMVKATIDKIHAAAEIQMDIDFFKIITLWFENDEDMSGTLDLEEMGRLMRNLGLEMPDEDLKKRMMMYQSDASSKSVKLTFPDLFSMYMDMTTIKAIADIFKMSKTTPSDIIDITDLIRFLRSSQKLQFGRDESYRVVESLFRDIKKDKGASFEVSPFPVILSLELHVDDVEQTLMVEIMRNIFGEQLLTAKEMEAMTFGGKEFTPLGLLRKILVKCKKEKSEGDEDSSDDDDAVGGTAILTQDEQQQERLLKQARKSAANNRLAAVSTVQAKALPKNVRGNIKTCINLLRTYKHFNIVSISEGVFAKWMKFIPAAAATTQSTLIRTYPKGFRFDSSNYNPVEAWELGAQCVALNLQTHDLNYYINRALFKTNGDSGYVLKPHWMREKPALANLKEDGTYTKLADSAPPTSKYEQQAQLVEMAKAYPLVEPVRDKATLRIHVICAQNISNPGSSSDSVSPYITITVIGPKYRDVRTTKTSIRNNGFDPHWLEMFEFTNITCVEMTYLYITIWTKTSGLKVSDILLGENAINLSNLRRGYRAVPFFNSVPNARVRKIAVLLCNFELQMNTTIDSKDI